MIRNLGLKKKMAAVIACATISTAAFAVPPGWGQRDPVCDQRVTDGCVVFWQDLGYPTYADCVRLELCYKCPPSYGYLCGYDPRAIDGAIKPEMPW